jgi:hypothetical protein
MLGAPDSRRETPPMRIHNIYADADGESHFRDQELDWIDAGPGVRQSALLPVAGMIFRQTSGEYNLDWHPAPRRQYVFNLDATFEVTASDGETRVIEVGDVLLVEDISGKGHLARALSGHVRHSIFIALDQAAD